MGTAKQSGIIIAESNMGDYDKMVTLLTPGYGKISCVAKGARKPKSQLMAGTQLFCFGEYMLFKGGENYHINSVETIEIFYNIRIDLDKLKYAMHINKIIYDVTTENQNCYKILQLYLNTLYMISETDENLDFILAVFKIRLLSLLGFTPKVKECVSCKEQENISYFSLKDNGIKCSACGRQDKSAIKMSKTTQKAIQYIILAPAKKLYSFHISEDSLKELELISKLYFNDKLEKEYKLENLF